MKHLSTFNLILLRVINITNIMAKGKSYINLIVKLNITKQFSTPRQTLSKAFYLMPYTVLSCLHVNENNSNTAHENYITMKYKIINLEIQSSNFIRSMNT